MADASDADALYQEAQQTEQENLQTAQAGLGAHAVAQQQTTYQQRIDAQNRAPPPPTQPTSFFSKALGIAKGAITTEFGGVGAAAQAAQEGPRHPLDLAGGVIDGPIQAFGQLEANVASWAGQGGYADEIRNELSNGTLTYNPTTLPGKLAENAGQFLTAFLPVADGLKLIGIAGGAGGVLATSKLAAYSVNAMAAGIASASAFNPHSANVSNLIQQVPAFRNPLSAFLASKPDDSSAFGTFKQAADGLFGSVLSEGAMDAFTAAFHGMRAAQGVADTAKALEAAQPTAIPDTPPAATDGTGAPIVSTATEDGRTYTLTSASGTTTVQRRGTNYQITDTATAPEAQGQGEGLARHRAAFQLAADNGGELHSDTQVSASAAKLYAKLEDEGYAVEKNPNVESADETLRSTNGQPVFKVTKGPPAPTPYEPPGLTSADTANPKGTPTGTPEAPQFDPAAAAAKLIKITPENAQNVLGFLTDGRYSEIPGALEDTHRTIPWDSLIDGANLKGLFNAVELNFGDMIRAAHGTGAVSGAAITQLAADIGGDPGALAKLYGDTTANGGLAARITAGYNIMVASARHLQDLAQTAHSLNFETDAGKQAIFDFQKHLQVHSAIVGQVRQSSQEIGRALWAHRSLKASSAVALQNIDDLVRTDLGPNAIKKFIKQAGNSGNLAAVNKAADRVSGRGFPGVIKEVAQGGMLSSLTTQARNLVGNAGNLLVKSSERYLAGAIGSIHGVLMPNAEHATIRSAIAHTAGMVQGVRDSWPIFVKALTTERGLSSAGTPIVRAIYKDTAGLSGMKLTAAQVYNRVGQAIRFPGRIMGAIDNLNKGIGYQADLSARAYTTAASEADVKGLTGDARGDYLDSRMADIKASPPPGVQEKSLDAGLYQSFQEAARTEVGEKVAAALNSHPLLKLLVAPFVHRPMNMLRQTLVDYTPLAFANPEVRAALRSNSQDTDLAIARMAIGTGGMAWAYHMADGGHLTGPRMGYNNTQSLDQVPPWSIRIGERWFKYDSIDPVGMWLAIGAGLHEAIQRHYDPNDTDTVNQLAGLARIGTQVMGQAAIDKSFMKSMDDLLTAVGNKDPNQMDTLMQRLVNENAEKVIPFGGMLRSVAESLDPYRKDSSGPLTDQLKSNFPILSREVPDKLDLLGRPIPIPAGSTSWFNPFGGATASADPLNQTLSSLALGIRPPPRQIYGVTLDQQSHNEVVKLATQTPLFGGQNLEQALRALTTRDMWHSYDHTDDNGVTAHSRMVQTYIDQAYDAGKKQFMAAHPDFVEQHIKQLQQQAQHYQPVETPQ